jgi:hypothetical protein
VRYVDVIARGCVIELVDVAVEHRRRDGGPRQVSGVRLLYLRRGARRLGRESEQREDRQAGRAGAAELEPVGSLIAARELRGCPASQGRIASRRVRLVVQGEYLRPPRLADNQRLDLWISWQPLTAFLARLDECVQVAAVVLPGVVKVVVGSRLAGPERINECKVQLAAIDLGWAALVDAVEGVPDELVRDEQPQQRQIPLARENREQRRAVGLPALARQRGDRVLADLRRRDALSESAPAPYLACGCRQSPKQLAVRPRQQGTHLSECERRRVWSVACGTPVRVSTRG